MVRLQSDHKVSATVGLGQMVSVPEESHSVRKAVRGKPHPGLCVLDVEFKIVQAYIGVPYLEVHG